MLPDTSDTDKMALIGRQTVLRKARRERASKVRDLVTAVLNNFDAPRQQWDLTPIVGLVDEINALTKALDDLC